MIPGIKTKTDTIKPALKEYDSQFASPLNELQQQVVHGKNRQVFHILYRELLQGLFASLFSFQVSSMSSES